MSGTESDQSGLCRLCRTPLAARRQAQGGFCCSGCARVYDVLMTMDEKAGAAYVEAARRLGLIPQEGSPDPPRPTPSPPVDGQAIRTERYLITGMYCPSCSWIVEQVLATQRGVISSRADFFSASCLISYDMRLTAPGPLKEALSPLGYRLAEEETGQPKVGSRLTFDFIACAVLTMNMMSLSALRYYELLGLLDHVPSFVPLTELILLVPVLILGWAPVLRRAWQGFLGKRVTMDGLISLSVGSVLAMSLLSLLMGGQEIYFETCAGLVTISLLGRMIEARLRDKALGDVANLMRRRATKVRQGEAGEFYTALDDIRPGDTALFRSGEIFPFDGEVASGQALVSEAVLTGEPTPLTKGVGDQIVAGSLVVEGEVGLRVGRLYEETALGRITAQIAEALARNEGRLRSADRVALWFGPAVVAIALGAWVGRIINYGLPYGLSAQGWFPSVAVMAVACPCAFSLAGVTAVTAAMGALVRRGFLVQDPGQLEELYRIDHLIFDKTGTITMGRMTVERLAWEGNPRPDLLPGVVAAEEGSLHPIAQALRLFAAERNIGASEGMGLAEDLPGWGRRLAWEGGTLAVGARGLFDDPFMPEGVTGRHSLVWFGLGRRAAGCFLFSDTIRAEAREVMEGLLGRGYGVELVSGDRQEACGWVADEVGLGEARGDVSLEGKVVRVRELRDEGKKLAFVGDGTNDALAMGEADVSLSLGRSTDEALAASGIVLHQGNLTALPWLFDLGKKLHGTIRGNNLWALAFNVVFIPLAVAGHLTPLLAMALMLVSSAVVLLNSLRMRRP